MIVLKSLALLTDGAGAFTGYFAAKGHICQLHYVPHASTPIDTGGDFTITDEETGMAILTITNVGLSAVSFFPRAATATIANAAALYAAGGVAVLERIAVAGRVKVVLAAGGATKQGTLYLWTEK